MNPTILEPTFYVLSTTENSIISRSWWRNTVYANRHFKQIYNPSIGVLEGFSHRVIGYLELCPVLGQLIAKFDRFFLSRYFSPYQPPDIAPSPLERILENPDIASNMTSFLGLSGTIPLRNTANLIDNLLGTSGLDLSNRPQTLKAISNSVKVAQALLKKTDLDPTYKLACYFSLFQRGLMPAAPLNTLLLVGEMNEALKKYETRQKHGDPWDHAWLDFSQAKYPHLINSEAALEILKPLHLHLLASNPQNKKVILATIDCSEHYLSLVHPSQFNDPEIILAAIEMSPWILRHASDEIKNNRELILRLIKRNPLAIALASDRLKDDRELVLESVRQFGKSIIFASDRLKDDRELVLEAVRQDGRAIPYVSDRLKDDREVVLEAVRKNGWYLAYASERLKRNLEIIKAAVRSDPRVLKLIDSQLRSNRDIFLAAIESNPDAYYFFANGNQRSWTRSFAHHPFDGFFERSDQLTHLCEFDPAFFLAYVRGQRWKTDTTGYVPLNPVIRNNRTCVLSAIEHAGPTTNLKYIIQYFTADREVMLQAVKKNPHAYNYIHSSLEDDLEIALEAVKSNGSFVKKLRPILRNNRNLMLKALKTYPDALAYADLVLRNDASFMKAAISINRRSIKYMGPSLRDDERFILNAIKQKELASIFAYASRNSRANRNFCLRALRHNPDCFKYLSLWQRLFDPEYRLAVGLPAYPR